MRLKTLDDRTTFGQGKFCSSLIDELNQVPGSRAIAGIFILQAQTLEDVSGRVGAKFSRQLKADGFAVLLAIAIPQRGNATASRSNLLNQTSEAAIPDHTFRRGTHVVEQANRFVHGRLTSASV
jgi:hypothetical protein